MYLRGQVTGPERFIQLSLVRQVTHSKIKAQTSYSFLLPTDPPSFLLLPLVKIYKVHYTMSCHRHLK